MLKAMRLRTQLVLLQVFIVLIVVLAVGAAALWAQERQLREASQDRMLTVAQSIAGLPTIADAYGSGDPAQTIQPIAELLRQTGDLAYVVVTDANGIRFSHPNVERIGERVSTDPDALSGEIYRGTQTGTLGTSYRVKVPVFGDDGEVIGQVSVGILESELAADFVGNIGGLLLALGAATVVGVVAAAGVARLVRRRIYGLEPEDIRKLLETREATLHGIREGLLAIDEDGRISLCNDAAVRLLALRSPADVVGQPARDVLEDDLVDLIAGVSGTGELQDQRLVLSGERVLVARTAPVHVHGKHVGAVVMLMDRTELDLAVRHLAGAQNLAEGLRAQHHEFSNTLHTIGGLIELGESEAAMRVIERAGDGGSLSSVDGPVPVADLEMSALLLAKRASARERGVTLTIESGTSLPAGTGDADLMTLVGNLLDNAIDAVGQGGQVSVWLQHTAEEGLRIVVDDDGPGIAPALRERVFTLGFSSKGGSAQRGYGLTLVSRVVERLGGTITIDDAPLGGARFRVHVPATADATVAVRP